MASSFWDGGGNVSGCASSFYGASDVSSPAYTLVPGARWACTSGGDCALH